MPTGAVGPGGQWTETANQAADSRTVRVNALGQIVAGDEVLQVGGSGGLSAVTYDGSSKVTGFSANGVTYAVTYPTGQIVVTGSDSTIQTITLDGSGRIQAVAVA